MWIIERNDIIDNIFDQTWYNLGILASKLKVFNWYYLREKTCILIAKLQRPAKVKSSNQINLNRAYFASCYLYFDIISSTSKPTKVWIDGIIIYHIYNKLTQVVYRIKLRYTYCFMAFFRLERITLNSLKHIDEITYAAIYFQLLNQILIIRCHNTKILTWNISTVTNKRKCSL